MAQNRDLSPLTRVGIIFGLVGLALAAASIAAIFGALRGGLGLGIAGLIVALLLFGLSGYFFWGRRYLGRRG